MRLLSWVLKKKIGHGEWYWLFLWNKSFCDMFMRPVSSWAVVVSHGVLLHLLSSFLTVVFFLLSFNVGVVFNHTFYFSPPSPTVSSRSFLSLRYMEKATSFSTSVADILWHSVYSNSPQKHLPYSKFHTQLVQARARLQSGNSEIRSCWNSSL